jgi:hypothetical protein
MATTLQPVSLLHLPRDPGPQPEPLLARVLRTAQRRVGFVLESLDCLCASQPGRAVSVLIGLADVSGLVHRIGSCDQVSLYDTTLGLGRSVAIGIAVVESDGPVPDAGRAADAIASCMRRASTVTPWSAPTQPGDAVLAAATSALGGNGSLVLGACSVRVLNSARSLLVDQVCPSAFVTRSGRLGQEAFALRFQRDDGDYTAIFRARAGVQTLVGA